MFEDAAIPGILFWRNMNDSIAHNARSLATLELSIMHDNAPTPRADTADWRTIGATQKDCSFVKLPQELLELCLENIPKQDAGFISLVFSCRFFFHTYEKTLALLYKREMSPWAGKRLIAVSQILPPSPSFWRAYRNDLVHSIQLVDRMDPDAMVYTNPKPIPLAYLDYKFLHDLSPSAASLFHRTFSRLPRSQSIRTSILRNLTQKQYLRGDQLLKPKHLRSGFDGPPGEIVRNLQSSMQRGQHHWTFGQALNAAMSFSAEWSVAAPWNGDKFDIVPAETVDVSDGWTDVGEHVAVLLEYNEMGILGGDLALSMRAQYACAVVGDHEDGYKAQLWRDYHRSCKEKEKEMEIENEMGLASLFL